MRLNDLFHQSLQTLKDPGRALEIELLISHAFGITRIDFWKRKAEEIFDTRSLDRFQRWFRRLQNNEPITYIIGEKEFYSRPFSIRRGVLIPRPETEILVESALPFINGNSRILDCGAGSGIISITLSLQSGCRVTAVELSRRVFPILQRNIKRYGLSDQIDLIHGDLFPESRGVFDMVISNPPYISLQEWQELPDSIRCYEPKMALVAGPLGTEMIERLLEQSPERIRPGGFLLLEVGAGQRPWIDSRMPGTRFQSWDWIQDFQGIDRVLRALR